MWRWYSFWEMGTISMGRLPAKRLKSLAFMVAGGGLGCVVCLDERSKQTQRLEEEEEEEEVFFQALDTKTIELSSPFRK